MWKLDEVGWVGCDWRDLLWFCVRRTKVLKESIHSMGESARSLAKIIVQHHIATVLAQMFCPSGPCNACLTSGSQRVLVRFSVKWSTRYFNNFSYFVPLARDILCLRTHVVFLHTHHMTSPTTCSADILHRRWL